MRSGTANASLPQKAFGTSLGQVPGLQNLWQAKWGIALAALVTVAAFAAAELSGGPVMIFALIGGLAISGFASRDLVRPGICFSAKHILYAGVVLLGSQIALADLIGLGWQPLAIASFGVLFALSFGWVIGRAFGLSSQHAILSAGAVAICGGSAAMAICAALPKSEHRHTATVTTIMLVAIISTLVMAAYPLIASALNFSDAQAGTFFGASIHNVAQAIGAGHIISEDAAQTASVVKLTRVACLVPAVVLIAYVFTRTKANDDSAHAAPTVPLFLIGFVGLVLINSLVILPPALTETMGTVSHFALVMSIVALGAQTTVGDLFKTGAGAIGAMCVQTAALAGFVLLAVSAL